MILVNYGAAMFSWLSFLMPASMIEERLNLIITLFLAEVAFCFVINAELPKVPYLTLLDGVILGSFVMLFMAGWQCAIAYILSQQGEARWFNASETSMVEEGETFDMISFFAFGALYTLWNVVQIWRGLRNRNRLDLPPEPPPSSSTTRTVSVKGGSVSGSV